MERTGAQILWECLLREGVEVVFGYPGGAILPAYDAMLEYPIRHVLVRHEQGAAHMARRVRAGERTRRGRGRHLGPGATNLTTGIANAMMDSVPTVFITGQVPSHLLGSDAFQETDVTGITLPITKQNFLVTDVTQLGLHHPARLRHRARRPPGSGARRHLQGHAAGEDRLRLAGGRGPPRPPPAAALRRAPSSSAPRRSSRPPNAR